MNEAGVGRVLPASLHQGIADLLPSRLEFYEAWLNPKAMRDGRIGLAPLAAVLSFLRLEGEPYQAVSARAGEYAADWLLADLGAIERSLIRLSPRWLRVRLLGRVVGRLVRDTYRDCRVTNRWRGKEGTLTLSKSVFCGVRTATDHPLCDYYASAAARLLERFEVDAAVAPSACRACGDAACVLRVEVR